MKQPCVSINARAGTTCGIAGGNATASVNNHPASRLGARNDGRHPRTGPPHPHPQPPAPNPSFRRKPESRNSPPPPPTPPPGNFPHPRSRLYTARETEGPPKTC